MEPSVSSSPSDCRCTGPNRACRRAGVPMVGRLWQLCAGVGCSAAASAAYRRMWDGQRPRGQCIYLGPFTGATRSCSSCRGRVSLKVFLCQHLEHAAQPTTTERDCRNCPDYEEPS